MEIENILRVRMWPSGERKNKGLKSPGTVSLNRFKIIFSDHSTF
jgi:hypothetical protein